MVVPWKYIHLQCICGFGILDREEANSWSILEQQTKAGSLANLFPQICVYSDFTLAELKDRAKKVVKDEEEEVISVCELTTNESEN